LVKEPLKPISQRWAYVSCRQETREDGATDKSDMVGMDLPSQ
jgi:hypothetical protein